ncbi:NB-ARC domain-containing protein [Streptomyces sp. NBC_00154]|uniref:NB-ARC domain-containing protein n=1 Tax=Streptomyces sp. NBC_00154 TaxID=2975670 RepID=UPI0022577499|nr:NB-ARC domain-containing protein [Streptomyces sp. NBC_00154]MCX5310348.1 NB-ARC domain-containing protein [Streptomyces sp. NBC_00154]
MGTPHDPLADGPILVGNLPREADFFQHREQVEQLEGADGIQVLVGAGGVGKSQLASHFTRRILATKAVDVVVWVPAISREAIQSTYAQAIGAITGAETSDPEAAATRFLAWAQTTTRRWLIILDDLTAPSVLNDLWPPKNPNGRVLVTTRRRDSALSSAGRQQISVGLFTASEAINYFTKKFTSFGRVEEPKEMAALAKDLDYLPLALAQSSAYLIDSGISCARYRSLLADRLRTLGQLLPDVASLPDDHRATVMAAWSLSIEQANLLQPIGLAAPTLQLAAMLDPYGIPESVFTSQPTLKYLQDYRELTEEGDATLERDAIDPSDAVAALRILHRLNLVDINSSANNFSVSMHSLVQRVVIEHLPLDAYQNTVSAAATTLLEVWPEGPVQSPLVQKLRSSAETLRQHSGAMLIGNFCHELLFRHGESLLEAGLASAAIEHFTGMRAAAEGINPNRPDLWSIRLSLGGAREQAGDLMGTLREYRSLILDETQRQGEDAEDVLHVRSVLAEAIGYTGDSQASVQAFEELWRDRVRIQGPNHELTRDTRRRLVAARSHADDLAGAIATCEELLADEIRLFGRDHPSTRHTRLHLAEEIGRSGDIATAIRILEELTHDEIRTHGQNHQATFSARHNLGVWYLEDGRFSKSIDTFQSLLKDQINTFGEASLNVIEIRTHLADAFGSSDDTATAIQLSEEILASNLSERGPFHPETLDSRGLVAHWKGRSGDAAAAVRGFSALLADCENILGLDHPMTVATVSRVAKWTQNLGDWDNALLAYRRLVSDRIRIHGENDSRVLQARDSLAYHMLVMGESEDALESFRQLHADQVRLLGEDHPDAVHTLEHIEELCVQWDDEE